MFPTKGGCPMCGRVEYKNDPAVLDLMEAAAVKAMESVLEALNIPTERAALNLKSNLVFEQDVETVVTVSPADIAKSVFLSKR